MIHEGVIEVIDNVIATVTQPLTHEEEFPVSQEEKISRVVSKGSLDEVNKFFYRRGWANGTAVMPPTEEAVKEMLPGQTYLPDYVVAKIPPRNGKATVDRKRYKPVRLPVQAFALECPLRMFGHIPYTSSTLPIHQTSPTYCIWHI